MHFSKVLKLLSVVMSIIAVLMLIPVIIAIIHGEKQATRAFLSTIAIMGIFSTLMFVFTRKAKLEEFSQRDGFLFTSLTWIFAAAFGAIPLVLTNTLPNYSDAFFEIISGFTTTGATRIVSVEKCYKSILFWRSLTNWLGGMGIVVLFIALLPALGSSSSGGTFNLMGAETVGPVKSKLTPKTKTTAAILWQIYVGLTFIQVGALLLGGLPLFDAVTISFSTVSTAGFCIKDASIEAYNSAYVDIVVTIFMVFASINFSLYYKIIQKKFRDLWVDTEFKVFLYIFTITTLIGTIYLRLTNVYDSFAQSLRYVAFHVASIISTTGFSNTNFLSWPTFAVMLVVMMMFVGGCAGSTGGGIKVIRVHTVFSTARNFIKRKTRPNSVYTFTVNNEVVSNDTIFNIFTFCAIYIVTWLLSALIISLTGTGIEDCLSSSILTLGNIGLGFGKKAFTEYPHWLNWLFSFLMLSGRLELITVYVLLSKNFWSR